MGTLREIAARSGVSISTASRALAGQRHVAEGTSQRVKETASELGYVPNALARDLRRGQTRTIGLLVPDMRHSSFSSDASVLLQLQLQERGYVMLLYAARHNLETELRCLERLRDQAVDGIIHVPTSTASAEDLTRGARPIPVVEFLRRSTSSVLDAVVYDDGAGAKTVIDYLLSLSHRRIGIISGPERIASTRRRVNGARQAVAGTDAELAVVHGEYSPETGRIAIHRFFNMATRPTAVFASSTQFVLGAMQAAKEKGLSIPADLSLVGFGDPPWGQLISPSLTTYALPLLEMSMTATLLIISRIERPPTEDRMPVQVTISGNLVVRDSAAALA